MKHRPEANHLRLKDVHERLSSYAALVKSPQPAQGWLRLVRVTLGRTQRQQAALLGVSGATVHKAEQSEADERITLGQLRKLADALDCDLAYALVPRHPLPEVVRERAREIAREEVEHLARSMRLDQYPDEERLRVQVERRVDELLRGRWSVLWRR